MSFKLLVPSDTWEGLVLECENQVFPAGPEAVPLFSRNNVVVLAKWLWNLDLELTYDPDDERRVGAPQETYLLDDVMKVLAGGIFTVAYPTDYGKSTLIEMSVVFSLVIWPKDTNNAIVKANEDAAVAAARVCWWKLTTASSLFQYCRPLTGLRQGNPEVKKGFFIEGSSLRTFGGRDPSVYPAGIGDSSLPGRRGRAHFDDLETENVVKSEAKMDTLKKQFNSCVRLIQRTARMLFMVAGTPQGANSIMYSVSRDFETLGVRYESITRPEYIREGSLAGKLLWPAAKLKSEIQRRLMDPAAYQIAYGLKPPGSGWYDGQIAQEQLKDRSMPWHKNSQEFRDWYRGQLYEQTISRIGFHPAFRHQGDVDRFVEQSVAGVRFYIGWDPATTGTNSVCLLAFTNTRRYILRSMIETGTPDEQAMWIKLQRRDFPDLVVIIEADAQQLAFAHVLMHVDPQCPWTPHQTTGYNKDSKMIGIPSLMREFMAGTWKLPWVNDEFGQELFGGLMLEVERWGPVSHPHGIPAIWFVWFFEVGAMASSSEEEATGENQVFDVTYGGFKDPQPGQSRPGVSPESMRAWQRRH